MKHLFKFLLFSYFVFHVNTSVSQQVYTFIGNGKWSDSANWLDKKVPADFLTSGFEVVIDPLQSGECILDIYQVILEGSILTVKAGKKFRVNDNMFFNSKPNSKGLVLSVKDSLDIVPILDTSLLPRPLKKFSGFELSIPLLSDLPPIGDQENQESCGGFVAAYGARSFYLHRDHCTNYYNNDGSLNFSTLLSPAFIHNILSEGNCSIGTSLQSALSLMKYSGVPTWKSFPYMGESNTVCNKFPDQDIYQNASIYKIDSYERIFDLSELVLKRVLESGNVILTGIKLDQKYAMKGSGKYVWESKKGLDNGTHGILIIGYDDNIGTRGAFKIMNSWGDKNWGYNGYGWIGYDYLKEVVMKSVSIGNLGYWEMFVMKTSPNFSVDFKTAQTENYVDQIVNLTDMSEPKPSSVEWSFPEGNPTTSTSFEPSVTYSTPGDHIITLKSLTCNGYYETKDSTIKILPNTTVNVALTPGIDGGGWYLITEIPEGNSQTYSFSLKGQWYHYLLGCQDELGNIITPGSIQGNISLFIKVIPKSQQSTATSSSCNDITTIKYTGTPVEIKNSGVLVYCFPRDLNSAQHWSNCAIPASDLTNCSTSNSMKVTYFKY